MIIFKLILQTIEIILYFYLASAALYVFVFSIASLFSRKGLTGPAKKKRKIAVLIPGYKEDSVIIETATQALLQNYPETDFSVVVIADSFQNDTLIELKKLPIQLVEVSFEKSTKSKALNSAMAKIGSDYEVALVLDSDNIMETDFLDKINLAFDAGYKVVQGHRVAKNLNTQMAVLDALSEEINNSIFRRGHRVLGLSSALIGSGMAFEYQFFKDTMANIDAVGGFDKELEMKLLKDGHTIEYLDNAYVLDEKVQKTEVFANQRRRWLSAQVIYFKRYFFLGLRDLFLKGNIDFFDKVYQMITPPRVLLLGFSVILYFTSLFATWLLPNFFSIPTSAWFLVAVTTIVSLLLAIPNDLRNAKLLKAIVALPVSFFIMLLSLFKLKGANKKFIHTQHGTPPKK